MNTTSIVRDNLVIGRGEYVFNSAHKTSRDRPFVAAFLDEIAGLIEANGDRVFMKNAAHALKEKMGDDVVTSGKVVGPKEIRLSEVAPLSRSLAASLYHLFGVRKGDVVKCLMPNDVYYHVNVFAAWLVEAVASVVDPTISIDAFASQLEETKARVIICPGYMVAFAQKAIAKANLVGTPQIIAIGPVSEKTSHSIHSYEEVLETGKTLAQPPKQGDFDKDDVAILFWSSGTTGRPKGIQHTFVLMAEFFQPFRMGKGRVCQATCFFHVGGFLTPIQLGVYDQTAYFFNQDDVGENCINIFHAIHHFKPDGVGVGTHQAARMASIAPDLPADMELGSINTMVAVGTQLPMSYFRTVQARCEGLKICFSLYSMTEIALIVAVSPHHLALGPVMPGYTVKIADPETGEALGPGQIGELRVKAPYCMKGYLNRPEEDEKFFGSDGFLHTGDNCHYDENGILYYDSRLKDLIKFNAYHIYPKEIEDVILAMPEVEEVCVFGVPDPKVQEWLTAAVRLVPGSRLGSEAVAKWVESRVAEEWKRLQGGVFFLAEGEAFPRNGVGKIIKAEVAKMVIEGKMRKA